MPFDIMNLPASALELYADANALSRDAIPYVGQLRKHKSEESKLYLRLDPLTQGGMILEFNKSDVLFAEEVKTITEAEGQSFRLAKLWVKKGSIGIKLEAFMVSDYSEVLNKY